MSLPLLLVLLLGGTLVRTSCPPGGSLLQVVSRPELWGGAQEVTAACRRDLEAWTNGLESLQPWALHMLDAWGKLPSGLLNNNLKSLGHFDQCLGVNHLSDVTGSTPEAQYCLASLHITPLQPDTERGEALRQLFVAATLNRYSREFTTNRSALPVPDLLPSMALGHLGVCVPASCSAHEVQAALSAALSPLAPPLGISLEVEVPQDFCRTARTKPWTKADRAAVILLLVLISLTTIASIWDLRRDSTSELQATWERILECFSAPANWRRLIRMPTSSPSTGSSESGDVACLHGIRAISLVWAAVGHKAHFFPQAPVLNKRDMLETVSQLPFMPIAMSTISVDLFFLMSGTLRATAMLQERRRGAYNFVAETLKRLVRITPALATMVLLYATLLPRLGDGPLWRNFVERPGEACRDSWHLTLTYLNNYLGMDSICMIQTWYLSADMHLFLLSPLLLLPAIRWPRLATPMFLLTGLALTVEMFVFTLANRAPPTILLSLSDGELLQFLHEVQWPTHHRAISYLVGLALGLFLYSLQQGRTFRPSKTAVRVCWAASVISMLLVIFGPHEMHQPFWRYEPLQAALYAALHRPVFAAAWAWVVLAACTGHAGWVSRALSWRGFLPLSRLSYSVFLVNYAMVMLTFGLMKTPVYAGEFYQLHAALGDTCVLLCVALVLHLLVEAPALRLALLALRAGHSKQPNRLEQVHNGEDASKQKIKQT